MKKGTTGLIITVLLAPALLFASCASLQRDVRVSAVGEPLTAELSSVTSRIVALDAWEVPYASGSAKTIDQGRVAELRETRDTVASLERSSVRDAVFEARLAAWSGRLFLLEGKRAEAEARLRTAVRLDATAAATVVLKSRLETDSAKRLVLLDSEILVSDEPEPLVIEKALTIAALARYREAVALFDEVLPKLPRVYAETYRAVRDGAWNMRDAREGASGAAAAVLSKAAVTWRDTLELTLAETTLLEGITARDGSRAGIEARAGQSPQPKADPRAALFAVLLDRGIIPSTRFTDGKYADAGDVRSAKRIAERLGEPILRADAAWFLWHAYAALREDPSLLSRYSRSLSERRVSASPVPDVPASSPFFDSVLGCVEWEFMSLVDGVSFAPEKTIDGAALLRMLRRVR